MAWKLWWIPVMTITEYSPPNTKDAKVKAIALPSAFSAMLGITEAAIFGINLRYIKPILAIAQIGSRKLTPIDGLPSSPASMAWKLWWIPDLILTPFLTVIISGFIALLIIGPAGRALGDGISLGNISHRPDRQQEIDADRRVTEQPGFDGMEAVVDILTPFLTVIISGFIALLIIGPAGRALGDGISFIPASSTGNTVP
jgi:phosphotransferase system  glucose/maltose/N-acetylglucosamine-specific IIC component